MPELYTSIIVDTIMLDMESHYFAKLSSAYPPIFRRTEQKIYYFGKYVLQSTKKACIRSKYLPVPIV